VEREFYNYEGKNTNVREEGKGNNPRGEKTFAISVSGDGRIYWMKGIQRGRGKRSKRGGGKTKYEDLSGICGLKK